MDQSLVCDEMVSRVLDQRLENQGFTVYRPSPSESDEGVLALAREKHAPIVTRDTDFIHAHRTGDEHWGLLIDQRMHYQPDSQIINAICTVFDLLDPAELRNTVVRLNRFY